MLSFSGMTLALGRGFSVDRCHRTSSVEGDAAGVDVRTWGGCGM